MFEKTFDTKFFKIVFPFILVVIFILFLPWVITTNSWFGLEFKDTGAIGDTLGGILGPFIAIVAAFLTFLAFWVQYKANEQLRNDIRIDRLEKKIYEMLNLHRQNVNELRLKSFSSEIITGRNIFPHIFNELKRTYDKLEKFLGQRTEGETMSKKTLLEICYIIFYIGIKKENQEYLYKVLLEWFDKETVEVLISLFDDQQDQDYIVINSGERRSDHFKEKFYYTHFDGHFTLLSHYYRHLVQIIKYIDELPEKLLNEEQKYSYMKLIRAQLSSYEQLLFYYGSLSPFGKGWNTKKYLTIYRLIKNMPLPLANFGVLPEELFAAEIKELKACGIDLFDWNK